MIDSLKIRMIFNAVSVVPYVFSADLRPSQRQSA